MPSKNKRLPAPHQACCLNHSTAGSAWVHEQPAAQRIQLHGANWCERSLPSHLKVSVFLAHVPSSF